MNTVGSFGVWPSPTRLESNPPIASAADTKRIRWSTKLVFRFYAPFGLHWSAAAAAAWRACVCVCIECVRITLQFDETKWHMK